MLLIMLTDKGFKHLIVFHRVGVPGEMVVVSEMPAATNHHQIDTGDGTFTCAGNHVGVTPAGVADILLFAHGAQCGDLIAVQRGMLILLRL